MPSQDGSVAVIDIATGRVLHTLSAANPGEFPVFSGDDRLVAAGGSDGTVVVSDTATGRRSGNPLRVSDDVVHAVFDPRGDNRLYTITSQGALTAWEIHCSGTSTPPIGSAPRAQSPDETSPAPMASLPTPPRVPANLPPMAGSHLTSDSSSGRPIRAFCEPGRRPSRQCRGRLPAAETALAGP